jgi:hypothetical protein
MSTTRPDQIDPRIGRTTDLKNLTNDENIHEDAKQAVQSNPDAQPMIPEAGTNPALRDLQERGKQLKDEER